MRSLFAPAGQCLAGLAAQGVAEGGQARREVVERIVQSGSGAAKMQETCGLVTPHGVQRIRQAEEQGAGAAKQDEPEQGTENGVVPVFQR